MLATFEVDKTMVLVEVDEILNFIERYLNLKDIQRNFLKF